ncbi:FadR family transcriptional regulator [Pseudomonas sp. PB120]|uniref:FadR/GntR family transcriptional regulator n=1 Tax=Pseudomonas sp. PB120 TaxID=2494700 RepID=UPI0012FD2A87|nr:FadR/GntR family transcriptional regulator [Pseudomonas sp. PB120]MVV51673.1 FadR family transcriptional regulator [Pseudomonas sp. PB120]
MIDNAPPPSPRLKRQSLAKTLVAQLSRDITEAVIPRGEKLPTESQIMKTYNVSRTVVREAISRLQAAGLVETRHGVGTFVLGHDNTHGLRIDPHTFVTLRDVIDALEFRASLEVEAAGLAAKRCSADELALMRNALDEFNQALQSSSVVASDFRFHYQIALATGNRYFTDIMSHFGPGMLPRMRVDSAQLTHSDPAHYQARLVREHEAIYDAIARRDTEAARAAMSVHLTNSRERLRKAHAQAQL